MNLSECTEIKIGQFTIFNSSFMDEYNCLFWFSHPSQEAGNSVDRAQQGTSLFKITVINLQLQTC